MSLCSSTEGLAGCAWHQLGCFSFGVEVVEALGFDDGVLEWYRFVIGSPVCHDDEDDEDLDDKDGGAFKKNMNKKKNEVREK